MNNIYNNLASIPRHIQSSFTNHFWSNLESQKQKVALVVAVAFGILATLFIAIQCCAAPARRRPTTPGSSSLGTSSPSLPVASFGAGINVGGNQGRNFINVPNNIRGNNAFNARNATVPEQTVHYKHREEIEKAEKEIESLRNQIADERDFIDVLRESLAQQQLFDDTANTSDKTDGTEQGNNEGDVTHSTDAANSDGGDPKVDDQAKVIDDQVKVDDHAKEDAAKIAEILRNEEAAKTLEAITEKEANIVALSGKLNDLLKNYPVKFYHYLEEQYSLTRAHVHEVHMHIIVLAGYLDNYSTDEPFVEAALAQIDHFLTKCFFTTPEESCLPEEKKIDLIIFNEFFTILNNHIHIIENKDPKLALKLKIKLANLPLHNDLQRDKYANIYLGEREQLNILVAHFQDTENQNVDAAIQFFQTEQLTDDDVRRLAKLIVRGKSALTDQNRYKLRDALLNRMGLKAIPKTWNDHTSVYKDLKDSFRPHTSNRYNNQNYYFDDNWYEEPTGIEALYRASIAKKYFKNQSHLPDNDIRISRWYHATDYQNLDPILRSKIEVRHKQAFNGAWVSSQREPSMGNCTLIFTHAITSIDKNPFIGYEKGQTRWRGLQDAIPMKNGSGKPYLAYVGLRESATKTEKKAIATILKNNKINDTKVFKNAQVDYIQKEILRVIGSPNLTEKYWGKADVEELEHPRT